MAYESQMPIENLIGDDVVTVDDDATLLDVAVTLAGADIGAVVVGSAESATGVVSERDIARAVANGADPATTQASTVASDKLVWTDAATTVGVVAEQMMEQWVRHVLIERDGRLAGIVSARDLLGVYASGEGQP